MDNNIDELLANSFQDKSAVKNDAAFTAGVMKALPRHGLPLITRTAIVCFFVGLVSLVSLKTTDYTDLYTNGEEIANASYQVFEYYLEEFVQNV